MRRDELLLKENEFLRRLVDSLIRQNEKLVDQITPHRDQSFALPEAPAEKNKGFENHLRQIMGSEDEEEMVESKQ